DTIYINENHPFWAAPETWMKLQNKMGWFSTNDPDHIAIHEIGHALHRRAIGDRYPKLRRDRLIGHYADIVKDEVSGYGLTNEVELVTEMYTAMFFGRKYSDAAMAVYEELGGPRP